MSTAYQQRDGAETATLARLRQPRLEWFEAILAYRHWRTIAETSRRLEVHQDLISERIRLLEEWFRQQLFERSLPHQRLTPRLTPFGERCLAHIQQMMAAFDDLTNVVSMPALSRHIVVALPESLATVLLPGVRQALHRRGALPPGGWKFITARSAVLRNEIKRGKASLGLLIAREPYVDEDLQVEPIARNPMCLVAATTHPFVRAGKPIASDQLRGEYILLDKEQSVYRAIFESFLRRGRIPLTQCDTFTNIEAVKTAAAIGPGIAMLPYFVVAEDVHRGRLGIIPTEEDPVFIQILLARLPQAISEYPIVRELSIEFRRQALLLEMPEQLPPH